LRKIRSKEGEQLETRIKIIEVAKEQFMHLGVRAVTMDEIARLSGVSKKTIYQEFTDKNALVLETFTTFLDEHNCMMQQLPELEDGVIEHLISLSTLIRKRFSEINPMVLNELQRYYPQCWALFEDFKKRGIQEEIIKLLEMGIEKGYFRPEIDTRIMSMVRIEQMMVSFDPIKFPPSQYNLVDLQIELFEHFLFGIFTEKGRAAYLNMKNN
jgi:TetR/AcrR family transcriptional regulator, cholesterol catabolism regulator